MRNGIDHKSRGAGSLGFGADEKPLDPFPFYVSQISSLGAVGADCSDVAKFYSLVRGVRGTLINAEHGVFDNMIKKQSSSRTNWRSGKRRASLAPG